MAKRARRKSSGEDSPGDVGGTAARVGGKGGDKMAVPGGEAVASEEASTASGSEHQGGGFFSRRVFGDLGLDGDDVAEKLAKASRRELAFVRLNFLQNHFVGEGFVSTRSVDARWGGNLEVDRLITEPDGAMEELIITHDKYI